MSNLRIGTSGWNYPSGQGTWNGLFYPAAPKGRRPKGSAKPKFDELAYYAEHFDTVEINSTFYGQPRPTVARSWADRTPPGFEFSLKLYRGLTHADKPGVPALDMAGIDEYRLGSSLEFEKTRFHFGVESREMEYRLRSSTNQMNLGNWSGDDAGTARGASLAGNGSEDLGRAIRRLAPDYPAHGGERRRCSRQRGFPDEGDRSSADRRSRADWRRY